MKAILYLIFSSLFAWALGFAAFILCVLIMTPLKPGVQTDAIVVLTGGMNRIETAMDLFADGLAPQLYITGVNKDVTKEDILSRRPNRKMPECCIDIGYTARSTRQNAAETKEWLRDKDYKTIRLVTSNYHIPRAMLEFRTAIPDVKFILNPIPQPDILPKDEYFWHVVFSEYNKTLFRFLEIIFQGAK